MLKGAMLSCSGTLQQVARQTRYSVTCPTCLVVLLLSEDPPAREDVSRLDRHERSHVERTSAESVREAA